MSRLGYFAELFVAGRLANAGWNIYFPHRDEGFDFVISKVVGDEHVLRPVQVKGKYPTGDKGDKTVYGYVGELTQTHPEMVLAIPYFPSESPETPTCVAYMPRSVIRAHRTRGYRCEPATYKDGAPRPRRDYKKFFDGNGIALLEEKGWKDMSSVESSCTDEGSRSAHTTNIALCGAPPQAKTRLEWGTDTILRRMVGWATRLPEPELSLELRPQHRAPPVVVTRLLDCIISS